jgi:hypothetical protein
MNTNLSARRGEGGRWTVERDGDRLVGLAGVDDDELVLLLTGLIVDGELEETDRIFVADGAASGAQRIDEVLARARPADVGMTLAGVRAERYASVEHYF